MLNWHQIGAVVVSLILFLLIYFGFDVVDKDQQVLEKSRMLSSEATSIQNLILEAKEELGQRFSIIEALNMEVSDPDTDSIGVDGLELLSGKWYELGFPSIAGYYAEEVAEKKNDAESWSIAGTTYFYAAKKGRTDKETTWSTERSRNALEKAISLEPENVRHKINLALLQVEAPSQEGPMKGITMLRKISEDYPDNSAVLIQLARLSLETGQYENAIKRLKQAETISPNDKKIACLLAETYKNVNDSANASLYNNKCISN